MNLLSSTTKFCKLIQKIPIVPIEKTEHVRQKIVHLLLHKMHMQLEPYHSS